MLSPSVQISCDIQAVMARPERNYICTCWRVSILTTHQLVDRPAHRKLPDLHSFIDSSPSFGWQLFKLPGTSGRSIGRPSSELASSCELPCYSLHYEPFKHFSHRQPDDCEHTTPSPPYATGEWKSNNYHVCLGRFSVVEGIAPLSLPLQKANEQHMCSRNKYLRHLERPFVCDVLCRAQYENGMTIVDIARQPGVRYSPYLMARVLVAVLEPGTRRGRRRDGILSFSLKYCGCRCRHRFLFFASLVPSVVVVRSGGASLLLTIRVTCLRMMGLAE